jgi:hypothetical protein
VSAALRILGAPAALYALHRLALWLESRGWLYYVHTSRRSRIWLSLAAAFDPNARRILEIHEAKSLEQDESGDDPPFKLGSRH